MMPLRVGMQFDAVEDIPKHVPANATLLDATEVPWMADDARYQSWGSEEAWPMTLLYLPRSYRGPVEAPQIAVGGTESNGGVSVPEPCSSCGTTWDACDDLVFGPQMRACCRSCGLNVRHNQDAPAHREYLRLQAASLPDRTAPTQEGYQQMMRQKSMAAHPAGSGLRPTADVPAGKARG